MEVIYLGKQRKNYIGQRHGKLTIVEEAPDYIYPNGKRVQMCVCKCDCGNTVTLRLFNALQNTQSCGCLKSETSKRNAKKLKGTHNIKNSRVNEYDLSNEYGIGYTLKGEPFYFDKEDFEQIKDYCWHISDSGYLITNSPITHRKVRMHRLIMGCLDKKIFVDHINHNKLDNRKSNLRLATNQQNTMNKELLDRNTSGVTGVSFDKSRGKWKASIMIDYKDIFLGRFSDKESAIQARKEAENKYFGEYSYDNSVRAAAEVSV